MKNFRFDDLDESRTYNSLAAFSIKNTAPIFVRQIFVNFYCSFKKTSQNKTPVKKGPDEISELKWFQKAARRKNVTSHWKCLATARMLHLLGSSVEGVGMVPLRGKNI